MARLYIIKEEKDKGDTEAKRFYFKAQDALKSGKDIKAIQYLKHALKSKEDYQPAHRELAEIYHRHGNLQDAQHHITKAIEIKPTDPVSLFTQGVIYLAENAVEPALKSFELSCKYGDLTWGLSYNLSLCYYTLGLFDNSIQFLNKAIKKDPRQIQPYLLLTQIFIRQKKTDMARNCLLKAKKMRPNDPQLDLLIKNIANPDPESNG